MILLAAVSIVTLVNAQPPTGRIHWDHAGREDLEYSLKLEQNVGIAKNVIVFIGDGMGPNTITAARIYRDGESSYLSWEKFPHVGLVKTYNANKQVPDSASTATAIFTGVKVNYKTLGVDESVQLDDCAASLDEKTHLQTLATAAQEAGKATGIVTTARVTHATPGAMYAHSASRDWECDTSLPSSALKCKDIGRQLVEDLPGKHFNVILGGGNYMMTPTAANYKGNYTGKDVLDDFCLRADNRNLISDWAQDKVNRNLTHAVVNNTQSLLSVDTSKTDYLLGVFTGSHMQLECERDNSDDGVPSLSDMTTTAIKVLMNNKKGFLLMVESALIDLAHHIGKGRKAIHEVLSLHDTVKATIHLLESAGVLDETLIIVTSDHAHTLSISGYPERGSNIFDVVDAASDGIPYTPLSYANSVGEDFHYKVVNNKVVRDDPSKVNSRSFEYGLQAAVTRDTASHGGNDIFVYARGPYAHLFHNMHEQNYINVVIKYAAKIGEYVNSI